MMIFWGTLALMFSVACFIVLAPARNVQSSTPSPDIKPRVLLLTLFCLLSVIVYSKWSHVNDVTALYEIDRSAQEIKEIVKKGQFPTQIVEKIKSRLAQDPKSTEGWFFTGSNLFELSNV